MKKEEKDTEVKKYCADTTLACGHRLISGEPCVGCGYDGYCEFQRPRQPQKETLTYFQPDFTYTTSYSTDARNESKQEETKNGK